ncbi:hypothetical protein NEF87_000540 [Candidatus Lokiarchaeum ossiferum]|uniref:Uncharacterized protein n=1 Tax=Candidatus Lokiarchaeum ossiferum TaxID=2951803 RepID=A0ABY6HLJ5_9ARCH|nr:hypothetical protein NEF87_000540 [Candidatus Lokiarchaeum sp. B-35]
MNQLISLLTNYEKRCKQHNFKNKTKMKTMNTQELFHLSKYVYQEAWMESQLAMAGSGQERLLEKMSADKSYMKGQGFILKFMVVMYLAIMIIFPIMTFSNIQIALSQGISETWVIFAGSMILASFLLMQILLLVSLSLMFSSGILTGEAFRWLATLPLEKKHMSKISIFAFFRGLDYQIYTMILVLPIGVAIGTQSILLTFCALILSVVNIILAFTVLVHVGEKVSNVLTNREANTKKNNLIRIGVIFGYAGGSLIIIMAIMLSIELIPQFFYPTIIPFDASMLNTYLGIIPFPLNGGYVLIQLFMQSTNLASTPLSSLEIVLIGTGFVILVLIIGISFRSALIKLERIGRYASNSFSGEQSSTKRENIEVQTVSPITAHFRKDKQMALRDIQAMTFIIIPLILSIFGGIFGMDYIIMSTFYIVFSILRTDGNGATIIASLPIVPREQAKAKLKWVFTVLPICTLIFTISASLFNIDDRSSVDSILIGLISLPIGPVLGTLLFEYKVRVFGKMKYRYSLEERNKDWIVIKWGIVILIGLVLHFIILMGMDELLSSQGTGGIAVYFLPIETICGILGYIIFNRMFPKPKIYD